MTSVASHPKRLVRVVHLKTVGLIIIYKTDDIMSLLVGVVGAMFSRTVRPYSSGPGIITPLSARRRAHGA